MADSRGSSAESAEGLDTQASQEQMRAVGTLGDLPLVAINQNPDSPGLGYSAYAAMEPYPEEADARVRRIWQELQSE